jgi:hypothetical protein
VHVALVDHWGRGRGGASLGAQETRGVGGGVGGGEGTTFEMGGLQALFEGCSDGSGDWPLGSGQSCHETPQ